MDITLSWVDLLMLAVLAGSLLLGLWRGLVFELMALVGWFVAYFASPSLAPYVARFLPADRMSPGLLHMASLVLAFCLVLLLWGMAGRLLRMLVRATPLSVVDRILGAGFGAVRGVLVCLLLVLVVGLTPAHRSATWQASAAVPALGRLLEVLQPMLPPEAAQLIPAPA